MQKTDFHLSLSFFAEKVILELNAQNHFFRASKNTNSVFSATKQIMRMRGHRCSKASFSVQKKLLNAILRAKLKLHEQCILSNEMNSFLQCRRQIFTGLSFFAEKVILELKLHKITSLELLRTPILCLVQTKQIMRMRGHRCSKASFSVQKKLLNAILRAKLKLHEKCFFLMK